MLMEVPLVEVSLPFCAESDTGADTILYWYEGVVADLGDPGLPIIAIVVEPAPWNLYDPNEPLWDTTPPLNTLLQELAVRTAERAGVTATGVLYQQAQLLDFIERQERDQKGNA